jgi:hypothetical protein
VFDAFIKHLRDKKVANGLAYIHSAISFTVREVKGSFLELFFA